MELPVKKNKALLTNPKLLVIFSKPKAGKTTLLSLLDNNLILDLEDGTDYIDSLSVKIKNLTDLREVRAAIIKMGKPYKYISFDTITALEDLCLELALIEYRNTPMGKNFGLLADGTYEYKDIRTLPNGGGYEMASIWLIAGISLS